MLDSILGKKVRGFGRIGVLHNIAPAASIKRKLTEQHLRGLVVDLFVRKQQLEEDAIRPAPFYPFTDKVNQTQRRAQANYLPVKPVVISAADTEVISATDTEEEYLVADFVW